MSDDDKLAMIQALVLHGANKEAVKALKSFRKEIKERSVPQKRKITMDKNQKMYLVVCICWFVMTVNCGLMLYFNIDKAAQIERLETKNTELQSKLTIKKTELITAKKDLGEAHEIMGELFLASMEITQSYNQLKKQCKKGKR